MPTTSPINRSSRRISIILSFFFVLYICAFSLLGGVRIYTNSLQASVWTLSEIPAHSSSSFLESNPWRTIKSSSSSDEIRILIGILTLPDQYHKRHFLRMIYGMQPTGGARVDLKFVLCNLTKEDQEVLVALEIMRFSDIMILNCTENLNEGKTYTYFSSLAHIFNGTEGPHPPYHYVMKTDDDTYIRLDHLVKSLTPLPREDFYYGYVIPDPNMDPFLHYMSGMGYLVSWDLVEWIRESDIPKSHLKGPEDKVFGEWLRKGHRARNRFSVKWSMYNYPEPPTRYGHELWPDTIAVHNLKTQERWIKTLQYFNVTKTLKPTKFYHIPE